MTITRAPPRRSQRRNLRIGAMTRKRKGHQRSSLPIHHMPRLRPPRIQHTAHTTRHLH